MPFPKEPIPDIDTLFLRVHKVNVENINNIVKIMPYAFDPTPFENPDGLSVNWSKYSNAEETKGEVLIFNKNPENYAVVSFNVNEVRNIPLGVEHHPTQNRAHSLIHNIPPRKANNSTIRMKLRNICKIELNIG